MQSSKVFLVVCAAVVCAVPLSGRGADTKAQSAKPVLIAPTPAAPDAVAKAREALRQKMDELNGQPSAPAPQAPTPAPQPPPAAEPPAPAAPPQTPVAAQPPQNKMAEVPVVQPSGPDSAAKAREALRQKMDELNGQPSAAPTPAPAAAVQPAPPQHPVAAAPLPKSNMAAVPALERGEREAIIKARDAMRQKMAELPSEPVAEKSTRPAPQAEAKPIKPIKVKELPKPVAGKPSMEFPALEGPPSPFPAEKQQRLEALLQKYKVDQLTPEQYHQQRAKVLAEP